MPNLYVFKNLNEVIVNIRENIKSLGLDLQLRQLGLVPWGGMKN
jgi:2-phospho-L-lactate transferase/gluconeogenesis factor (CofD/UPF0052 family)